MSSVPPAPAPAPTQPFYTSKTFWTMFVAAVFNLLPPAGVTVTPTIQMIGNVALAGLGIVFRWQADTPLAVK